MATRTPAMAPAPTAAAAEPTLNDAAAHLAQACGIAPDHAAALIEEVDGDLALTTTKEVDEERAMLERFCRLNARYDAEAERVKAQLKAYLDELEAKQTRLWSVLGPRAEAAARKLLAGGKTKSLKLAFGTVGFRTTPADFKVDDDAAVIAWAKANGFFEWVRVKEELSRSAMKGSLKSPDGGTGGELPPGVTYTEAAEKFYVR